MEGERTTYACGRSGPGDKDSIWPFSLKQVQTGILLKLFPLCKFSPDGEITMLVVKAGVRLYSARPHSAS